MNISNNEISVYIHWPFCKSKCPYCDFNSHVRDNIDANLFLDAYLKEIEYFSDHLKGKQINSVFFGGGTPSLMPVLLVDKILNKLAKTAHFSDNCEITLEANPTSSEASKFKSLKNIGVNRLSIGVQSLNKDYLKFLGREHNVKEALEVLDTVRNIYNNYSFDLIYCLPNQDVNKWEEDIEILLNYANTHVSLYQLTIEKGTPFYQQYKNGKFQLPSDDSAAELYLKTIEILESKKFNNYEVSNFAKSGFESRHNLAYWNYKPYLGIGAGSHSRIHNKDGSIESMMMIHSPENWLSSVAKKNHGIQARESISDKQTAHERLMMGLRLSKGINIKNMIDYINMSKLEQLVVNELLVHEGDIIRPTLKGKLLLNSIIFTLLN